MHKSRVLGGRVGCVGRLHWLDGLTVGLQRSDPGARRALSVADVPEEELGADTEGALEEEGLEDHVVLQVGLGKGGDGKGGGREDSEG